MGNTIFRRSSPKTPPIGETGPAVASVSGRGKRMGGSNNSHSPRKRNDLYDRSSLYSENCQISEKVVFLEKFGLLTVQQWHQVREKKPCEDTLPPLAGPPSKDLVSARNLLFDFDLSSSLGKSVAKRWPACLADPASVENGVNRIEKFCDGTFAGSEISIRHLRDRTWVRYPVSFQKSKRHQTGCHKYCFNKKQRLERCIVIRTGLSRRGRFLRRMCKPLSIRVKRLSAAELNKWVSKKFSLPKLPKPCEVRLRRMSECEINSPQLLETLQNSSRPPSTAKVNSIATDASLTGTEICIDGKTVIDLCSDDENDIIVTPKRSTVAGTTSMKSPRSGSSPKRLWNYKTEDLEPKFLFSEPFPPSASDDSFHWKGVPCLSSAAPATSFSGGPSSRMSVMSSSSSVRSWHSDHSCSDNPEEAATRLQLCPVELKLHNIANCQIVGGYLYVDGVPVKLTSATVSQLQSNTYPVDKLNISPIPENGFADGLLNGVDSSDSEVENLPPNDDDNSLHADVAPLMWEKPIVTSERQKRIIGLNRTECTFQKVKNNNNNLKITLRRSGSNATPIPGQQTLYRYWKSFGVSIPDEPVAPSAQSSPALPASGELDANHNSTHSPLCVKGPSFPNGMPHLHAIERIDRSSNGWEGSNGLVLTHSRASSRTSTDSLLPPLLVPVDDTGASYHSPANSSKDSVCSFPVAQGNASSQPGYSLRDKQRASYRRQMRNEHAAMPNQQNVSVVGVRTRSSAITTLGIADKMDVPPVVVKRTRQASVGSSDGSSISSVVHLRNGRLVSEVKSQPTTEGHKGYLLAPLPLVERRSMRSVSRLGIHDSTNAKGAATATMRKVRVVNAKADDGASHKPQLVADIRMSSDIRQQLNVPTGHLISRVFFTCHSCNFTESFDTTDSHMDFINWHVVNTHGGFDNVTVLRRPTLKPGADGHVLFEAYPKKELTTRQKQIRVTRSTATLKNF